MKPKSRVIRVEQVGRNMLYVSNYDGYVKEVVGYLGVAPGYYRIRLAPKTGRFRFRARRLMYTDWFSTRKPISRSRLVYDLFDGDTLVEHPAGGFWCPEQVRDYGLARTRFNLLPVKAP
jgi:hypothetical protein